MRGQRQTEKKVACTGPSPKHETHVWAWEGEDTFGLEGPTAAQERGMVEGTIRPRAA